MYDDYEDGMQAKLNNVMRIRLKKSVVAVPSLNLGKCSERSERFRRKKNMQMLEEVLALSQSDDHNTINKNEETEFLQTEDSSSIIQKRCHELEEEDEILKQHIKKLENNLKIVSSNNEELKGIICQYEQDLNNKN